MDRGAVIVVLAVSPLAVLSLRTVIKSCSTSVYTPYRMIHLLSFEKMVEISPGVCYVLDN
jgi:hypothetical protein